jgi:hypothetical protein
LVAYKFIGTDDPDRDGAVPGMEGARYHIAKRLQSFDGDTKVRVISVAGANFRSEDVTAEVNQAIGEKTDLNTSADRYDDPEYIRKRLGNPEPGTYDPIIAKSYVMRLDSLRAF